MEEENYEFIKKYLREINPFSLKINSNILKYEDLQGSLRIVLIHNFLSCFLVFNLFFIVFFYL